MDKRKKRKIRHKRVRAVIKGTTERPRLSVFRSASHIYAQLIDDTKGVTLFSANDNRKSKINSDSQLRTGTFDEQIQKSKIDKKELKNKEAIAFEVGESLAKKVLDKGISSVVFDRGGYKYHGRVKALADGARKGGLKF